MSEPRSEKTFRERCMAVDEFAMFCDHDASSVNSEFEDDGSLHVRRFGVRAVFDVSNGQSLAGAAQNANTLRVMTALGLASKIGSKVLVEEIDEDDGEDCCPECGRPR